MISNPLTLQPRWLTFTGIALMMVLTNLDLTIVNLAIPSIARVFHTGFVSMQWIINSTTITCAMTCIMMGRMADIYGHRTIFLISALLFLLGSLLAAFAPYFTILIIGRAVQGIGIAGSLNTLMVIATGLFPKNQRGRLMGYLGVITGLSQAIGPPIGGAIIEHLSWKWVFLFNVPLSMISLIIMWNYKTKEETQVGQKIHYTGAIVLSVAIFLLILALNHSNDWGLTSSTFWISVAIATASFALFFRLDRQHLYPLIDQKLIHNPALVLQFAIRALIFFLFFAFLFIVPIYFQNTLGLAPSHTGQVLVAMTATFGITAYFGGRLTDTFGTKNLLITASVFFLVAFSLIAFTLQTTSLLFILCAFFLYGAGLGMAIPSNSSAILTHLPKESAGVGVALIFTSGVVGGSIGVAITGTLYERMSTYTFMHHLPPNEKLFASQNSHELHLILTGAHPISELQHTVAAHTYDTLFLLIHKSLVTAFSFTTYAFIAVSLLILITSLCIKISPKH